jgi:hypothetical protein
MPLLDTDQRFVDGFFAAIAPYEAAFTHIGFSYLAIKFGAPFTLMRGRVFMNTSPPPAQPQHFQSSHVRAGNYTIEDLDFDVCGLINQLLTGTLKTPHGDLHFMAAPGVRLLPFIPMDF